MRVLVLSCNTGQGHNSCAKAIKEVVDANGEVCDIVDALGFISKRVSTVISRGHVSIYRHCPRLFSASYRFSESHPSMFNENSFNYKLLSRGRENIYNHILAGRYDAVICTHVFTALMLTDLMKYHPLKAVTAFVATDYTCSPSTEQSDLNWYFIPSHLLESDFEKGLITKEKMCPVGIPVRQQFYKSYDKAYAKYCFDVPASNEHLLIMSGSMGCGPIVELTEEIVRKRTVHQDITIVCGTNKRLRAKLVQRLGGMDNVHIRGYVENMGLLMDSADLYLTKPGGISISEAAVKGLPMILLDAVAGCERYNGQFYLQLGAAQTADTIVGLAAKTIELLSNHAELNQMSQSLSEAKTTNAAVAIYQKLQSELEK